MCTLRKLLLLSTIIYFFSCTAIPDKPVYMFSYFKDNGEDGLHLAFSKDGYTFKALNNDQSFLTPELSKDKLMRDPCIIRGANGLFHMVWTVSWNEKGFGYASSPDLTNWSRQLYVPVMERDSTALNCWAPEITYDKKSNRYYIYWATTIPGHFPETDSTGDDGYNHRIYFTTTSDFKSFDSTKLLFDPGFNVIDASIVADENNYIMFFKNETRLPTAEKNLRIATSSVIDSGYNNISAPITGPYWAEGATAAKINNQWIVYFDKYRDHQYGAVESRDLVHWQDVSEKISFPAGTRHGTVFIITSEEFRKFFPKEK